MSTESELTKLRLQAERARREREAWMREAESTWLAYVRAMREAGLCAACEKPLPECRCVVIGEPEE